MASELRMSELYLHSKRESKTEREHSTAQGRNTKL